MKLPISWLKDYVDFDDSIEGLCDQLIFSGVEVEGIERHGGDFEGLVVGEILAAEKHPEADKLQVCTVSDGENELQVICGAPNARAGLKTAFAPVGGKIQGKKLKKAKLRGVESFGMLCSASELGVSADHAGIMELPGDVATGANLESVLPEPDIVLDLDITPNRPDCLCILGLAREIAVLYGKELKRPEVSFNEVGPAASESAAVDVQDTTNCPRYIARTLTDVKIGPSPEWMQSRLQLCGIRPINNAVDITNYVMLETGQPLHAFDHDQLEGGRIVVRPATEGETMVTLDEEERSLNPDRLMICDAATPVCVAGVMGGLNSGVSDGTSRILLESASFDSASVRATGKALGLMTDSSYRFSRGTDMENADYASRRAIALFVAYADATAGTGAIDTNPSPFTPYEVKMTYEKCSNLIGIDVPPTEIRRIFEALQLVVTSEGEGSITVKIPSFRLDLTRDVDLVEEVARIYGLDKIPAPSPQAHLIPGATDTPYRAQRVLREKLVGLGLQQAMNYSLVDAPMLDKLDPANAEQRIVLPNPMSKTRSILRTSLVPQMMESLGRNKTRQVTEAALFEVGPTFATGDDGYEQTNRVCIGLLGPVARDHLDKQGAVGAEEQFFALKGLVEQLGDIRCQAASHPAMDVAADLIFRGKAIGQIGIVKAKLCKEWRITDAVAVAELELNPLLAGFGKVVKPKPISEFPASQRDAALILDSKVSHEEVLKVIKKAAPKELVKVDLFDIYEGDKLPEGKRSLAYRFTYQAIDRTLKDEESQGFHNKIKKALRDKLGADVPEDA